MDDWGVALTGWVVALAGSPWLFLALYAFVSIDGVFPPVPSESVLIALAALSASTGEPALWALCAVGALGAFTGDQVAYSVGRRLPVRSLRLMRGPRGQRALDRAERALAERGAAYIVGARYVPVGRVAVNMTAGTVGFSRRRFTALAAVAASSWSVYSVSLGIGAGVWLKDHPLAAVVVGVVSGMVIGVAVDAVLRRVLGRRRGRAVGVVPAADAEPATGASGVTGGVAPVEGRPVGTLPVEPPLAAPAVASP